MLMKTFLVLVVIVLGSTVRIAVSAPPAIATNDFERLHKAIRPQPGESPWREIGWLTNITEARQRAIKDDKPLIIFTAADGSPLGRT